MCFAITTRRDTSRWEKFCHRRPTVSSGNGTSIFSLADCMHGHGTVPTAVQRPQRMELSSRSDCMHGHDPVLTVVHRPQRMEPRSVPVVSACMATTPPQQSYNSLREWNLDLFPFWLHAHARPRPNSGTTSLGNWTSICSRSHCMHGHGPVPTAVQSPPSGSHCISRALLSCYRLQYALSSANFC